jgi:hypothetical protein
VLGRIDVAVVSKLQASNKGSRITEPGFPGEAGGMAPSLRASALGCGTHVGTWLVDSENSEVMRKSQVEAPNLADDQSTHSVLDLL